MRIKVAPLIDTGQFKLGLLHYQSCFLFCSKSYERFGKTLLRKKLGWISFLKLVHNLAQHLGLKFELAQSSFHTLSPECYKR